MEKSVNTWGKTKIIYSANFHDGEKNEKIRRHLYKIEIQNEWTKPENWALPSFIMWVLWCFLRFLTREIERKEEKWGHLHSYRFLTRLTKTTKEMWSVGWVYRLQSIKKAMWHYHQESEFFILKRNENGFLVLSLVSNTLLWNIYFS